MTKYTIEVKGAPESHIVAHSSSAVSVEQHSLFFLSPRVAACAATRWQPGLQTFG